MAKNFNLLAVEFEHTP